MTEERQTPAPTISVVIPVYNGENYLGEAITSVLAQSYRDFEIIVVDDGSSDGTWAIIEQFAAAHPGVVYGICKKNGGVYSALNTGIRAARGKYIAWLSHDDRFTPHKLERQMEWLDNGPNFAGVYSDYSYINPTGRIIGRVYAPWYPQPEMLRHLLYSVFINGSTLLIERRCFQQVGLFDESLRYAADALMWANLVMHFSLAHIPEPLTEYRLHPQQATSNIKQRVLHQESQTWVRKTLKRYGIGQIFPELAQGETKAGDLAQAHIYIADVVMLRFWYTTLALRHYGRALWAWPNWHNPVFLRAARALLLAPIRRYKAHRKSRYERNFGAANYEAQTSLDLRPGFEDIKCVRFGPEY